MIVPTSCRAYRADARSAGRDICGNQDLHVPVLQRARDMQVFLYILPVVRTALMSWFKLIQIDLKTSLATFPCALM